MAQVLMGQLYLVLTADMVTFLVTILIVGLGQYLLR